MRAPARGGIALVAGDNFSARYDLDRLQGVFSRPTQAIRSGDHVTVDPGAGFVIVD
jgi:hypothetical protein